MKEEKEEIKNSFKCDHSIFEEGQKFMKEMDFKSSVQDLLVNLDKNFNSIISKKSLTFKEKKRNYVKASKIVEEYFVKCVGYDIEKLPDYRIEGHIVVSKAMEKYIKLFDKDFKFDFDFDKNSIETVEYYKKEYAKPEGLRYKSTEPKARICVIAQLMEKYKIKMYENLQSDLTDEEKNVMLEEDKKYWENLVKH